MSMRLLVIELNKRASVVVCCIRLHNFCIDLRSELNDDLLRSEFELEI